MKNNQPLVIFTGNVKRVVCTKCIGAWGGAFRSDCFNLNIIKSVVVVVGENIAYGMHGTRHVDNVCILLIYGF